MHWVSRWTFSVKKVCQRLWDQVSSLRWDLICPRQLIGLKKWTWSGYVWGHPLPETQDQPSPSGEYESSTVTTMRCCERRLNCSPRHESGNISLRSRKGYQWLGICWVTLYCEGMTATSVLNLRNQRASQSEALIYFVCVYYESIKRKLKIRCIWVLIWVSVWWDLCV